MQNGQNNGSWCAPPRSLSDMSPTACVCSNCFAWLRRDEEGGGVGPGPA